MGGGGGPIVRGDIGEPYPIRNHLRGEGGDRNAMIGGGAVGRRRERRDWGERKWRWLGMMMMMMMMLNAAIVVAVVVIVAVRMGLRLRLRVRV